MGRLTTQRSRRARSGRPETSAELGVQCRRHGRRTVITVRGALTEETAGTLQASLAHVIGRGRHDLVVDVREVQLVDQAGLSVLQAAGRRLRAYGGGLEVVGHRTAAPLRA